MGLVNRWTMRELCPIRHMDSLRKEISYLYIHLEVAERIGNQLEVAFAEEAISQREGILKTMEDSPVSWRDPR